MIKKYLPLIITGVGYLSYIYYKLNKKYNQSIENELNKKKKENIKKVTWEDSQYKLIIPSNNKYFDDVLRYIHIKYPDKINKFNYSSDKIYHFNEWRYR